MLISREKTEFLRKLLSEKKEVYCSGLFMSARWFVLSQIAGKNINIIMLPDRESAEYCANDLYNITEDDNVFFLPASGKGLEKSNYKASLEVQRTSAISKIIENDGELLYIVTYPGGYEENIPDISSIESNCIKIAVGDEFPFDEISQKLFELGFEKVDFVSSPGQYAIRGSILDIFSFSYNYPFRISFFGNEVESIHKFDCNTQTSIENTESAEIVSGILSKESSGGKSLSDILSKETVFWLDSSEMYKERVWFGEIACFRKVFLETPLSMEPDIVFNIAPQPVFNKNFELLSIDIRKKIEERYKVYVFGEKKSQLDRLSSILSQNGGLIPEFISGKNIHNGFIDKDEKICCYSDHEIFDRFHRVSIRRSVDKSEQLTLNELNSFNIGDYVVHIDHGIGIFGGLVRMKDDKGKYHEVVKITYREGDVVFVSVHSLHKISKYRSSDGEIPKIHKLGSKTWLNLKSSAKSKVKDIAKDLIQLYARRKAEKGYSFSADTYLQEELESSFIYEDTPDQESATRAIKRDMEDSCPMDRLVCGDVGFGKTELAIRAAFKAIADGKQVAVLVPTTILALQHFKTFTSRLKDFPCNIDYVSRLRTAKEINRIKETISNGQLDILIGTHKILGAGFNFKDLGLLVIDEEQKFGVSAKEKLRQLKNTVDTLTLTATPIPRTLQFSLLGARDLSIINTPPPNRIPVQTEIILFDEKEIKSILEYELNRQGQIFFLHNKVNELPAIEEILHRLEPDMKICVAHGQMEPKVLEDRMLDFINGEYDLLLCTTIIENGLDIPNANTIIINQAQNIGLSDLHQLRGRVGRSNRRAFCYLIVPPLVSITEDARRRLKAIEEFSDLGSGFNIAMQDLDIRGAGNLLGAEQSGFVADMGFETYQKILSEAMEELGIETGIVAGRNSESFVPDCTIETDIPAYIPDTYIDIPAEKIRIYKNLDSAGSDKEIDRIQSQLEDRFGKLPEELDNLFTIVKIRNIGKKRGFEKIIIKNGLLIAFFITNQMSPYYKTAVFNEVLENVSSNNSLALKQSEGRLKIVTRNITTAGKAYDTMKRL